MLANYANSVEKAAFLSSARQVLNFDVRPVAEVDVQMDIQDLHKIDDQSYEAFLAIHVLNHVADDRKALSEIHRVLKKNGVAVITIPYREGSPTTDHDDVTEHYGKAALEQYSVGSYRRYGLQDATDFFAQAFSVQIEDGFDSLTSQSMKIFFLHKA